MLQTSGRTLSEKSKLTQRLMLRHVSTKQSTMTCFACICSIKAAIGLACTENHRQLCCRKQSIRDPMVREIERLGLRPIHLKRV